MSSCNGSVATSIQNQALLQDILFLNKLKIQIEVTKRETILCRGLNLAPHSDCHQHSLLGTNNRGPDHGDPKPKLSKLVNVYDIFKQDMKNWFFSYDQAKITLKIHCKEVRVRISSFLVRRSCSNDRQ